MFVVVDRNVKVTKTSFTRKQSLQQNNVNEIPVKQTNKFSITRQLI